MPSAWPHPRITPIDSLRGLAAVWVADYHFGSITGRNGEGGYLCVDLFFILSGIVLTHVYGHRIAGRHVTFREFLVNRLARLYPLHLLTFFLMVAITVALIVAQHQRPGIGPMLYTGILNLILLQNVGLTSSGLFWNVPAWSISTEIVVNVLWFGLLLALRRTTALFVGAVAVAAGLLAWHGNNFDITSANLFGFLNGGLLRCIAGFFLGCLLHRWFIGSDALQRATRLVMNLLSAPALAAVVWALARHPHPSPSWFDPAIVLLAFPALVLCALHHGTLLSHLLQRPLFRSLGDISYSVYLLQWPLAVVTAHLSFASQMPLALWMPVYFGILLAGSTACYHAFEMPARNYWRFKP